MRKLLFALTFLLSLSGSRFGQYKDYKLTMLKAVIGVPQDTKIAVPRRVL